MLDKPTLNENYMEAKEITNTVKRWVNIHLIFGVIFGAFIALGALFGDTPPIICFLICVFVIALFYIRGKCYAWTLIYLTEKKGHEPKMWEVSSKASFSGIFIWKKYSAKLKRFNKDFEKQSKQL